MNGVRIGDPKLGIPAGIDVSEMVRVGSLHFPFIAVEHDGDSNSLQDDKIGRITPVAVKVKAEKVPVILGRFYNNGLSPAFTLATSD
jgi:hypothetical protein